MEWGLIKGLKRRSFKAILADPPWAFKAYAPSKNPESSRNVERHYDTMKLADIQALPIRDLCNPKGCHLFLWATGPFLPKAIETMSLWGFRYSGIGFTWIKLKKSFDPNQLRFVPLIAGDFHTGLGFTTRKNAEFCLLGRRGSPKRIAKDVRELIIAPRREHSRKPDETRERIERYCDGPYLELFGRQARNLWTVRGDQADKFSD